MERRKENFKKEDELKKLPKLDIFVRKSKDTDIAAAENDTGRASTSNFSEKLPSDLIDTEVTEPPVKEISVDVGATPDTITEIRTDDTTVTSDIGQYIHQNISDETKKLIISLSLHRPKGPFPKDPNQNNRCFSETYDYSMSKYGPTPRLWLCYSTVLDAAYCEPCSSPFYSLMLDTTYYY